MAEETIAERLNREGNEYIRNHHDADFVFVLEKCEEIEKECKKNHSYFHKDPDVAEILEEKENEYQMVHGTRFSARPQKNRFLNYNND